MALRLIEAPTQRLLPLEDAKAHLRADHHDDDDALIESYIDAATSMLDGRDGLLQRALAPQSWALELPAFPTCDGGRIALPLPPLLAVEAVEYLDELGAWHEVASEDYEVDAGAGCVVPLESWPSTGRAAVTVRVTYRAGYRVAGSEGGSESGDAEPPPAQLIQLLKLLVANFYETREPVVIGAAVNDLPLAAQTIIGNLRVYR